MRTIIVFCVSYIFLYATVACGFSDQNMPSSVPSLQQRAAKTLIEYPAQLAQQLEQLHDGLYDQRYRLPAEIINKALLARIPRQTEGVFRKKQSLNALAFSPNGQMLAIGTSRLDKNRIYLINARTREVIHRLFGHHSEIESVAFSPDGTVLGSAAYDHTVRLWDVKTGECFEIFRAPGEDIYSIAFSPIEPIFALSHGNTIRVGKLSNRTALHILSEHEEVIYSVAFSPDGRLLASSSKDCTIRIWDMSTGRCLRIMRNPVSGSVYSVAFSPDGTMLASGAQDRTVRLWDVALGECVRIFSGHTNYVYSVAFSPDGTSLASGSIDFTIRLWNPETGDLLDTLAEHTFPIYSIAFSPDGSRLASASWDYTARVWRINYLHDMLSINDIEEQRLLLAAAQDWLAGRSHQVDACNPVYQALIKRFEYLDDKRLFFDPVTDRCMQVLRTAVAASILGAGLYISSWFM